MKKSVEMQVRGNNDSFNFEAWASLVKPQLIAALQKRAAKAL